MENLKYLENIILPNQQLGKALLFKFETHSKDKFQEYRQSFQGQLVEIERVILQFQNLGAS